MHDRMDNAVAMCFNIIVPYLLDAALYIDSVNAHIDCEDNSRVTDNQDVYKVGRVQHFAVLGDARGG